MSKKISQLALLELLTGREEIPVTYNGENFKVRINTISSLTDKKALGLDKVDNTSDQDKPISLAQQQALDEKASAADFNTLSSVVADKAAKVHKHGIVDVEGLSAVLESHSGKIAEAKTTLDANSLKIAQLERVVGDFSIPTSYPISSIDGLTAIIQDINTRINQKANATHQHSVGQIVGFAENVNSLIDARAFATIGTSDW